MKTTPITAQEMQLRSAKARWSKLSKEERSEIMRRVQKPKRNRKAKAT
jgi:predicted Fe-S protein YdhL (DUF1289 family)